MDVHVGTWQPATSLRAPDKIISSNYSGAKVFLPTYEKNRRPCIEMLITNEYQRLWWKEKEVWDKMEISAKASGAKRRLLLHLLVKRRKQDVRRPDLPPKKARRTKQSYGMDGKNKTQSKEPKDMEECKEAAEMETNMENCADQRKTSKNVH